jgi:glycosyltransferase involved in cell wall biosynthesis
VNSALSALKDFDIPLILHLRDCRAICPAAGMVSDASWCSMFMNRDCLACSQKLYGSGPLGILKSLVVYLATKANKSKLSSVSKFIAVSSHVKRVHQQVLDLKDEDIQVIPNFYADDPRKKKEVTGKLPDDYILFVGGLYPEKGVDILIDAYRNLNTETKLVIIGAKKRHYQYQGTDNILVIVDAPHEEVMQAYLNCRFAIFPSILSEAFGMVVVEAMSRKKAVITSTVGGFPDVVADGTTGIMVPPNDVSSLSQAMRYLLENPAVAVKMGQKGYERWKKLLTPEAVIPQIEDLYKSLV